MAASETFGSWLRERRSSLGMTQQQLANREYAMDAWELGVSGYILKPLTLERVKQELSVLRFPVHGLEE